MLKVPRIALGLLLMTCIGGPMAMAARAATPARTAKQIRSAQGSSSREARDEAMRAIPYNELDRHSRVKVGSVLANTTIYRRLPTQTIECDAELFVFLIEHPDLVVNMWEVLGVSEVDFQRTGDYSYAAGDKAGTRGQIEYLYEDHQTHLIFADGTYTGSVLPRPVHGRCVILLRSTYARTSDGRPVVRVNVDAFLQLDNVGVSVLAKTFQPMVTTSADHNFRETTRFLASVHRAAETNYAGMQRMAQKLSKIDNADRQEFSDLTTQLAVRAALAATASKSRAAASAGRPATAARTVPRVKKR